MYAEIKLPDVAVLSHAAIWSRLPSEPPSDPARGRIPLAPGVLYDPLNALPVLRRRRWTLPTRPKNRLSVPKSAPS